MILEAAFNVIYQNLKGELDGRKGSGGKKRQRQQAVVMAKAIMKTKSLGKMLITSILFVKLCI